MLLAGCQQSCLHRVCVARRGADTSPLFRGRQHRDAQRVGVCVQTVAALPALSQFGGSGAGVVGSSGHWSFPGYRLRLFPHTARPKLRPSALAGDRIRKRSSEKDLNLHAHQPAKGQRWASSLTYARPDPSANFGIAAFSLARLVGERREGSKPPPLTGVRATHVFNDLVANSAYRPISALALP